MLAADEAATLAPFRPESPHHVYLALAGGAGFPALIAYLAVLVSWFALVVRSYRSRCDRRARAVLLGPMAASPATP